MSCSDSCNTKGTVANKPIPTNSMSYVIILVLYILLAIIIGTCLFS